MKTATDETIYDVGQQVILTIQGKDLEGQIDGVSMAYPTLAKRLYSVKIPTGDGTVIGLQLPIGGVGMRPAV